jgi:ABC-2 type transport system ATP-binding protein
MNVLTIAGLTKRFGAVTALDDVSFSVEVGEIFGFLGPNGAGKSTTMRCIMDYTRPTSGSITILGKDSMADAAELKRVISYVPAEPNLYPGWTVDAHIGFIAELQAIDKAQAARLKEQLQLDGTKKVRHLSTGNQQKLAIILALVRKPSLLLLDEPTRGLDPLLRSMFHGLLRDYQQAGGTVLLSSHDLSEVDELCTKLSIIRAGRIVSDTTLDKLKEASLHKCKVTFSGKVPDLSRLGVEDLAVTGSVASFMLRGDMNPMLRLLAKHQVADMETSIASLEDIFMELYV